MVRFRVVILDESDRIQEVIYESKEYKDRWDPEWNNDYYLTLIDLNKKYKIEIYSDRYIQDYPDKITNIESYGIYNALPENIWCNDEEFKFETKWLDIDWKSYFEELKQSTIKGIQNTIERIEASIIKHKENLKNILNRNFEDLKF